MRACFRRLFASVGEYDALRVEAQAQARFRVAAQNSALSNADSSQRKQYVLSMFPYPSGALHMGHVRVYAYGDCLARFQRMRGARVLFPIGWDSFGLPAENAARERNLDPREWTDSNIAHMKRQLESLGLSFDWSREISTCTPEYFRWTQWLFLQLHKKGLAYQAEALVNWDPVDQTVLANEQVDSEGKSWRSGAIVEQRKLKQWFFGITKYADALLNGLNDLSGWPMQVKKLQELWIGKSEGMMVNFGPIRIFTTRIETLMGVTFVAVAPSSPWVGKLTRVLHPITGASLPVVVAEHVLSDYGTGAVMGVPWHDDRDAAFAKANGISFGDPVLNDSGTHLINSGPFSGLSVAEAREKLAAKLEAENVGIQHTSFKLRDWLVSRQRPWGAPIPVIHCKTCGPVPVPERDLPVPLAPRNDMNAYALWKRCQCPRCKGDAERDTDTMDTFVDSSWYFLRYTDPHSTTRPCDPKEWMAVDTYIGGVEHAVLHLLYARFVNRFLHEIGWSPVAEPFTNLLTQGMVQSKTFRLVQGNRPVPEREVDASLLLHRPTGGAVKVSWEKMSKSKLNGVDPQAMVEQYGADATRLYVLFRAPPHMALEWDESGIQGMRRWLGRLWQLVDKNDPTGVGEESSLGPAMHDTIKQVTEDLDKRHAFNTAIAALMTLSNALRKSKRSAPLWAEARDALFIMLAPLAPHIADEAWHVMHNGTSVFGQKWPDQLEVMSVGASARGMTSQMVAVNVMVNGKKRGSVELETKWMQEGATESILQCVKLSAVGEKWLSDASITQTIVVAKQNMVNIVTGKKN